MKCLFMTMWHRCKIIKWSERCDSILLYRDNVTLAQTKVPIYQHPDNNIPIIFIQLYFLLVQIKYLKTNDMRVLNLKLNNILIWSKLWFLSDLDGKNVKTSNYFVWISYFFLICAHQASKTSSMIQSLSQNDRG